MTAEGNHAASRQGSERGFRKRLIGLPRAGKRLIMLFADAAGFFGCLVLCGWLQLIDPVFRPDGLLLTAGTLAVTLLLARFLGFYDSIVRHLGTALLVAGAKVATGSAVFLAVVASVSGLTTQSLPLGVVYAAFCGLYLVGSRYLAQSLLAHRAAERVIVYGAGEAGASLVQALEGHDRLHPVAFIDDDPALRGNRVNGLRVHARQSLPALVKKYGVSSVVLALPSVSNWRRREIIAGLEGLAVYVQTVPGFNALISGQARVEDIGDLDVEDLLLRPPVAAEDALVRATLYGKSVMVTGAGGSIGSELCRQVLRAQPRTLVLFERSGVALHRVEREMRALAKSLGVHCEIVPLPGSVQDGPRVEAVMQRCAVNTVYHAAADNHGPLEEHDLIEGVSNTVFGTRRTALAAMNAGVETFVLVSTDKAVSPTSVMGASQRMAELVLQALQESAAVTRFAMVRFGNVLESSGSMVPLIRDQIRASGPVTMTHPEVTHHFLTIPEAARLVIQAGAMARGGEVFVLDMGEPVKINDLARRMISLMGLTVRDDTHPAGDIEIRYTGSRGAEQRSEAPRIGDNVSGTRHPRIRRAREKYLYSIELNPLLDALQRAASDLDSVGVRDLLRYAVKGYRPGKGVDDLVCREREARPEYDSELFSLRTGKPLPSRVEPPTL